MNRTAHIRYLLENVNQKRLFNIQHEIKQKESWAIDAAENQHIFDKTHKEMVQDFIIDSKSPKHAESINKLMIQFISSAFSYNRIRKQLRKINREIFQYDSYPIREDHKRLLAYLLNDERFLDEEYWQPANFESLVSEVESNGKYRNLHFISNYWLEHIMGILQTAPAKLIEVSNQDVNAFYFMVDRISNKDYRHDVFKKAEELWGFATQLSIGIRNVGTNLTCDFLKESGFTDYAKMDIHMIRSMSEILNVKDCSKLTDFESFVVTQWLANRIKMTPFKLDKILYVYGVYNT